MCVKDLTSYLLTVSVQGQEVFYRFIALLEGLHIHDEQCVIASKEPW